MERYRQVQFRNHDATVSFFQLPELFLAAVLCARIIEAVPGSTVAVIGTLYKDMSLKPNILDEFSAEVSRMCADLSAAALFWFKPVACVAAPSDCAAAPCKLLLHH